MGRINPFHKNPVVGVLFTKEHDSSAHVHDLSPQHEARRLESLERIFGNQQEASKKRRSIILRSYHYGKSQALRKGRS